MTDHDPGDEHREPWPFTCGPVFEVRGDDDMVKAFIRGEWHVATAVIDRSKARTFIEHADGRVEDVTAEVKALSVCVADDEPEVDYCSTDFHACQYVAYPTQSDDD